MELLKYVAPLGVGGVLAWGMFLLYRKDSVRWALGETSRADTMTSIVKENTAAITELTSYLKSNGDKGR